MVLTTHVAGGWPSALSFNPGNYEHAASRGKPDWCKAIAIHAANGVSLFFVVSAFTLTMRAVERDQDLRHYALRVARIGPATGSPD